MEKGLQLFTFLKIYQISVADTGDHRVVSNTSNGRISFKSLDKDLSVEV